MPLLTLLIPCTQAFTATLRHQEVKICILAEQLPRTNSGGKTVQWTNISGPSLSLSPAVNYYSYNCPKTKYLYVFIPTCQCPSLICFPSHCLSHFTRNTFLSQTNTIVMESRVFPTYWKS